MHHIRAGLAGVVHFWLDEEWAPLAIHQEIGAATAAAYLRIREAGAKDMADLVLLLSNELLTFDFTETFVGAFDIGNKVVEVLMQRAGIDVCCASDDDAALIGRYEESQSCASYGSKHPDRQG